MTMPAFAAARRGAWSPPAGTSSARPRTARRRSRQAERCNPDVVLLDVGLPDISGIEVARLLHERLPDVAVVMISTQDRSDYGDLALASGARGFLTKLDLSSKALEALVES